MRRRILETRNALWSGERRRMQLACGDKIDDLDFSELIARALQLGFRGLRAVVRPR